jgi:hypothetical protein
MGNYHHHQNPSAFSLDLNVVSTVCNLYAADGLYVIDSTQHSPLIGFTYDGFPIYGAYGYKNTDGTGGITRMKSSYRLRNITTRTTSPTGTAVSSGPAVSTTYPLGYFREDYEYVATSAATPDFMDSHNGRFCVTPEYPQGIYCYFATVDKNWNSAYPYVVGPTFYGVKSATKVTTISETVSTYVPTTAVSELEKQDLKVSIYPNPTNELIAIQLGTLSKGNMQVQLIDVTGRIVKETVLVQGSTIAYFETATLYSGTYSVRISDGRKMINRKVVIVE